MGGDDDNGYEARQQGVESKKMEARAALNRMFGAADEGTQRAVSMRPTVAGMGREGAQGYRYNADGEMIGAPGDPLEQLDQAGYSAALSEADRNRMAREGLYDTVRTNAFDSGKRRLDEDKSQAGRKLKFELFAKGLSGGSEDIDQNALLGRTYNQGVMDLGAKADSAKAQFRGDDETTRLQLLQSIDAGMDQGSALSSASSRMQVAADRAAADANGMALGNVFDNAGLLYEGSQAAKGRQAGQDWWNQYSASGKKGGSNPTGVTTRLPGE